MHACHNEKAQTNKQTTYYRMLRPFDQLVGAAGDVAELEYISALHQTTLEEVRQDASIEAEDIRLFLSSRYGIVVTTEEVQQIILNGFVTSNKEEENSKGRDDEPNNQKNLDLMELVTVLLIPTLVKASVQLIQLGDDSNRNQMENEIVVIDELLPPKTIHNHGLPEGVVPTPPGMLQYVLKMILQDVSFCWKLFAFIQFVYDCFCFSYFVGSNLSLY